MEDAKHEQCKLLWIFIIEKQACGIICMLRQITIFDEVWHLIAVAAYTWKAKSKCLDEDETVGLEVTRHAEDVTHVVILGFLIEGYLTDEVITGYGILDGVLLRADDIQFDVLALLTEEFEGIVGDVATLALEVFANEEDLVVRLRLWAN